MKRVPRISVIVPVHNRRELIRGVLNALAMQTFRDFEVIVVDDGSDDGSAEEVEADARAGRPSRVIRRRRAGAVAARAAGVAASEADLLAFTDSDCIPAQGWLAAGVAALDAGADMVNGRTVPAGPVDLLSHSVASGEEGLYPTCNLFFRRAAYDAVGGFDAAVPERMGFRVRSRARMLGFGEDTLLAWRVRRAGVARYEPEALVEHEVLRTDLIELLSRTWMTAAFPALVREVPELRHTTLFRVPYSLGQRSRAPVYATAAGIGVRSRRTLLLAELWWAVSAYREARRVCGSRRGRLRAVPVIIATDAVQTAALLTGSLRARSIVL